MIQVLLNAGITSDKTFQKMDHASWQTVLATNLDGVFNCTKVFIDNMVTSGWGRVVNITSVIGQIGNFGQVNYAASKAGVAAFTKSLAQEVARACMYLCSADGEYITGSELKINGGLYM